MAPAKHRPLAETRDVRRLTTRLTKMSNAERSSVPGIGPKRSEIVIAGAHVYAALLEHFALPGFLYSELGLRDGILAQMLAEQDAKTTAHQQFERDRWLGCCTCKRYGVDPRQASRTPTRPAALSRPEAGP